MKLKQLSALLALIICTTLTSLALAQDFYPPGVSAAQLLRLRGFQAEELYLTTTSGYVLRVTRGRNRLFENATLKEPVLFIHGVLATSNNWLLNSFDVKPKDLTNFTKANLEQLADEPSAKSLPLLALNRAREVYLWDRRGRPGSQQLVGDPKSIKATPSSDNVSLVGTLLGSLEQVPQFGQQVAFTMDRKFWNFSQDEQVEDFREMIDFVLKNSPYASKVSVVAHSAGGAITLMALSTYPDELTQKLSRVVLWSPAFARGNGRTTFSATNEPIARFEESFVGPIPAPFVVNPLQATTMLICTPPPTWATLCEAGSDFIFQFGFSGGQQPMRQQFLAVGPYSTSSHELAQARQPARYPPDRLMHKFDFGREGNLANYNQETPPLYNLTKIKNFDGLSFYAAATDGRVSPADVLMARRQLSVPSRYRLIEGTFNHIGYFFHINAPILAVIPSMQDLEANQ